MNQSSFPSFHLIFLAVLCCVGTLPQAQGSTDTPIDTLIRRLPLLMRSNEEQARKEIAVLEQRSLREKHRHGLVQSLFHRAWLSYRHEPAEVTITRIDSALLHVAGIEKDTILINFYILKGQCFVKKKQFGPALQQFHSALDIARKRGDKFGQTRTLVSIGWAYMEDGKAAEAIRFFKEVLQLNPSDNYETRALLLCNIAACYNQLADYRQAEIFATDGIEVSRHRGDNMELANGLNILARSYHRQGKLERAMTLLQEAASVREKVADPSMLASDYLELANLYQASKRPAQALIWAQKAAALSAEHHITLKLSAAEEALAGIYSTLNDHRKAAYYLRQVLAHKDSLSVDQYNNAFAQMQVEYETKKKEAENLQLKQENLKARLRNSQQQRWLLLLGSGLLVVAMATIFVSRLIKSRYLRRLAEAKLQEHRQRTLAVMEAEESERRRIAGDLHDGVGQLLAAASLNLSKARNGILPFEEVNAFIDRAATEVRAISHQVTPELLLHYGLEQALAQEMIRLNASCAPTEFTLYTHVEAPLKKDLLSLTIYRCFQELCANIIRHASAKWVTVQLQSHEEGLQLMVEDDGVGFLPDTVSGGLGLANMRSRLILFDGQLIIDSKPGRGTTSIITIRSASKSNSDVCDSGSAG